MPTYENNHALTLKIPEPIYASLVRAAEQLKQKPEDLAIHWLTTALQEWEDDPVEKFIGAFRSDIPDWLDQPQERNMQSQKVADMTDEELKALINRLVDERVSWHQRTAQPIDKNKLKQMMESIDRHRWTPPVEAPSVVEMLREDRDR